MMDENLNVFRKDESGLSTAFFLTDDMHSVITTHVDALEAYAQKSQRNARICVFENSESPLHAMLITQFRNMDSRPRVMTKPKCFMPLRGRLILLKVDFGGNVVKREVLSPGQNILSYIETRQPYIDIPVDEITTHLEITIGPHDRVSDRNFPPVWWDEGKETRERWREEQIRMTLHGGGEKVL